MLDPESEQIREVYADYGLAMYEAQCLERFLAILLASQHGVTNVNRWILDERFADNFSATLGILAKRFAEFARDEDRPLANLVTAAVDDRNWLAHHYFWERSIEFYSAEGREKMLAELLKLANDFENLHEQVSNRTKAFLQSRGVGEDFLNEVRDKLLAGIEPATNPKRLDDSVRIVSAWAWHFDPVTPEKYMLVLRTDKGENLVMGEKGLCAGPETIPDTDLVSKAEFAKALPADVSIRPKGACFQNIAWSFRPALKQ